MAFNTGNQNGLMAEINVTPMVDVMLVLLIIFMVTAPMMVQGMDVNLPQVTTQAIDSKDERLVISINANGEIFLGDLETPQPVEDLSFKIKRQLEVIKTDRVYLRADRDIPYGLVAQIMGQVRAAGVTNLGLVTEPEAVAAAGTDADKKTDADKAPK